ncbi:MAG: zinc-binding alcohol dehydrogenase [Firmicutes bacterium]|nr:zinc-binding alcohol dehydrogenase [Bacillota bacterium]
MKRRAICFLGKGKAVLKEEEIPGGLMQDEVLVQTLKTLISPGTELALYTGTHVGFKDPKNTWAKYPHYPGYICLARVIEIGPAVSNLKVGDIVLCSLNHCSHGVVKSSDSLVIKIPDDADWEAMLFARMALISCTALVLASYSIGDNVAVIGLGIVGNLCGQLFQLAGTNVYGIEVDPGRISLAKSTGISQIVVGGETSDVKQELLAATDNLGIDIVIEATGIPGLVNQALGLVNNLGQVIMLGSTRGLVNIDVYTHIHRKGLVVRGAHANLMSSPRATGEADGTGKYLRKMINLIHNDSLKVKSLITHRITPDEAVDAYNWLLEKPSTALGVVIDWCS